ncbi:MAG: polyphenol oxidase family protein [Candidatus Saccharimonas sp.]|nr:polyphenol oxidase family protein [Candidatus Saccharimonas sp.]
MIRSDQPQCFPKQVVVRVSSKHDDTMLDRTRGARHDDTIISRRQVFTRQMGIDYENCVYQLIQYDDHQTYDMIVEVGADESACFRTDIHADALFTRQANVGLFLPIADCVGTVIYDPDHNFLALAHVGRHASVADLPAKVVDYFVARGSEPKKLIIWMAPHAGKESYRLDYFDHKDNPLWKNFVDERADGFYIDMSGYARHRYIDRGVLADHIKVSHSNTATNPHYFSHSQGDAAGRFAVLAYQRHS